MAYKHGVYNTEQATSLTVPVQGSAGLQVVFGTAPIHLAKDPAAAVNTPKLVYSYKEAVEAVGYSDDFEKAKKVIEEVWNQNELILKDPAPSVRVSAQSASSIDLTAKVWCKNDDYWTVNFDMLEQVKTAFDQNGIQIPFNQLDVHIKNQDA